MVQLEAKQKARKKGERQSLMGEYRQVGCRSTSAPSPGEGAEAQRRVGAELEAGGPCLGGQPLPGHRGAGEVALTYGDL